MSDGGQMFYTKKRIAIIIIVIIFLRSLPTTEKRGSTLNRPFKLRVLSRLDWVNYGPSMMMAINISP